MRATAIESAGPALAQSGRATSLLARSVYAWARRILALVLIGTAAAGAIIALRIGLWAIGHPEQSFFRELIEFWS